jgi:beta-mannanase
MYRRIHDTFAITVGVTNVTWVWVVNHESFPPPTTTLTNWNVITNYYPGDGYVDVISVDGFNCGNPWKTFNQTFSKTLTTLKNAYPGKPIIIGEFASVEGTDPMSKANWITDAYSSIKSDWPEIRTVVWYNSSVGGDPAFPLTSSPASIQAYKEAIADPHFIGDPGCIIYLPLVYKSL